MAESVMLCPARTWDIQPATPRTGWDQHRLEEAALYAQHLGSAAVVVVVDGVMVVAWGAVDRPLNCHSIRKSLFSGLFGKYVQTGAISLTRTLADLDIDDCDPPLTFQERQATVEQLLMSRSGVYHWSNYQPPFDRSCLPARGTHPPGSFFMYNNWDFNALGTIFEQCTQQQIFPAFQRDIAVPLQMEDFNLNDTEYASGPDSIHPAYVFRMSARDLARYGLLYQRHGRWGDQHLIPREWVKASTSAYSRSPDGRGYGYLWWVGLEGMLLPNVVVGPGSYAAFGVGGHFMVVLPELKMVVVHRYDTDQEEYELTAPSPQEQGALLRCILGAYQPYEHGSHASQHRRIYDH
jgi:CubicO group peptidase (beta-lactamase class C family)